MAKGYSRKDMFPQYFRMKVSQPGVNAYGEQEYKSPVQKGSSPSSLMAMEVLWIDWDLSAGNMTNGAIMQGEIGDRSAANIQGIAHSGVLDSINNESYVEGSSGAHNRDIHQHRPKQAADGFGMLFTNKSIYIRINSAGQAGVEAVQAAVAYRLVDAALGEFYDAQE